MHNPLFRANQELHIVHAHKLGPVNIHDLLVPHHLPHREIIHSVFKRLKPLFMNRKMAAVQQFEVLFRRRRIEH